MGKPALSILIPVTKNESDCLPATLECLKREIIGLKKRSEIIVIANKCKGITDNVAQRIFASDKLYSSGILTARITHCETPGEMFAVNKGIDVSEGENLLLVDGDVVVDSGSLAWALDALKQPGVKVVSMHHAPIKEALPKDDQLATIILMNALRRHAFPEKYWLHGAFLGWNSKLKIGGRPMRFPEGRRVHDDNWLTAVIARDYGFKAIRVTLNYMVRFIPPQNWTDYYNQQWRYQFANEDLSLEFPELSKFIFEIHKWINRKYPERWINREWRELCIKEGIDFDKMISFYNRVLARVRAGREESKKLLNNNGVWKQQITTKHNPNEKKKQ